MKKFCILLIVIVVGACASPEQGTGIIELIDGWKFKTGDDPAWSDPKADDSDWMHIVPGKKWETLGIEALSEYDGYAWYRIKFFLPENILKNSYFGKELQITLGAIDDTEQTYLNGKLLGTNGKLAEAGSKASKFEGDPQAYSYIRNYVIPVDDERIIWGGKNVIAIRVNDHGGGGGMTYGSPSVSMVDIKDFISIDTDSEPFDILGEHYTKTIHIYNNHKNEDFRGDLVVKVTSYLDNKVIYETKDPTEVKAKEQFDHLFTFTAPPTESYLVEYSYYIDGAHYPVYKFQGAPYILTPPAPDEPRINGPAVFGVRPGNPVLYTVPVSGKRPITYSSEGLPDGVVLDSITGYIRGMTRKAGEYPVILKSENSLGADSKKFVIKVGDAIQLTPPMGWNSWNCWGLSVSDEKVRSSADAMVRSGLINYGWTYMNIDDGWEAAERTGSGELLSNEKFPDMNALSDHIHGLGLKIGIYSSPGPLTCGGYLGSYRHENQDARTWAGWNIDYLKYDWCSYRDIYPEETDTFELQKPYISMRGSLDRVKRDIVYSLCQYGMGNVSAWGGRVGGNLWRTTYDITDTWESLESIGFSQDYNADYNKPGQYNDPDMMILGWVGWGPNLHPSRLTADEQYTHVSLWCLLSAPLLLGNDLSKMDDFTLNLLTNHEVLAINQDEACRQARKLYNRDNLQVWVKELSDGTQAVGFFNMGEHVLKDRFSLSEIDFMGKYSVHDLWRQVDMGEVEHEIDLQLMPHGVYFVKMARQ